MTAPPDEYRVRLTTLCKWPRFSGYGFNLHKRKDELGHFIGFIDPGSPAEHAGLMENDRLHEVNGVNVLNEPHEEVVERIKNDPDEVTLLVVSPDGENYYRERGITIHGGMDHIVHRTCPATQQGPSEYGPPPKEFRVRLCTLRKWSGSPDYGFNLHSRNDQRGHYIGEIDHGSPATKGGLRQNDYLYEVNGETVLSDPHEVVVDRVKRNPDEVTLLVVSPDSEKYYKERGINIHGGMDHILIPDTQQNLAGPTEYGYPNEFRVRRCTLRKAPTYSGYGFDLHQRNDQSGYYIGPVDAGSPAENAGLRQKDLIYEVNGETVRDNDSQPNMVDRIKRNPDEVTLLVVSPDGEKYYKERGINIHGGMDHILIPGKATPQPGGNRFIETQLGQKDYGIIRMM